MLLGVIVKKISDKLPLYSPVPVMITEAFVVSVLALILFLYLRV